jgi:hypothetical protein
VDGRSEENLFWRDEGGVEHGPTAVEFRSILRSHLFHNYNITYDESMFFKLWRLPLVRESNTAEQNRQLERLSLKTIWNLLQVGPVESVHKSTYQLQDFMKHWC